MSREVESVRHRSRQYRHILKVLLVAVGTAADGPVHQAFAENEPSSATLHSPCVIEVAFAPADRMIWENGAWLAGPEYLDIGKTACERLFLRRNFRKHAGTWDPGLEMYTRVLHEGATQIDIRATINNPHHNHDKMVTVQLELLTPDKTIQLMTIGPIEAEDNGNDVARRGSAVLPVGLQTAVPLPKLRITMIVTEY